MAIRYDLRTFKDIVDAVMEECQIQATDTVERNRIKRSVQMVYLNEVAPFKQWHWLRGTANLQTEPYFGTGTADVTSGSCVVQLSETLVSSKKNYFFSVDGSNVKYRILAHTAGTGLLTLESPYGESTDSAIHFKIWSEALPLPNDLEEVIELTHGHHRHPVTPLGLQELRRLGVTGPKAEGHPAFYTTTDYQDPTGYAAISGLPASATRASSGLVKTIRFASTLGASETVALIRPGDQIEVVVSGANGYRYSARATVSRLFTGSATNDSISYTGRFQWDEAAMADTSIVVKKLETEGYDRYREVLIHPSIYNSRVGLHLDYIKMPIPLEADTDEPSIPTRDRIVLYYGALYHTWSRKRNPEEAAAARSLFQAKLDKMAGKTEDSPDKPQMVPSKLYMGAKRSGQRLRSRSGQIAFAGAGSTTAPSGTPSRVAVFESDGSLQSSSITTLELDALAGIDSNIQDQIDALGLASPVNNRVLYSSDDAITESNVTLDELQFVSDTTVSAATLLDNTVSPTTAISIPRLAAFIDYAMTRGAPNVEAGRITLVTDGSTAAIAQGGVANIGDCGVTFSAIYSDGAILLQYVTTSTGTDVDCDLRVQRIP